MKRPRDIVLWAVIGGPILAVLALIASLVSLQVYWVLTGTSEGDAESLIDANVSPGDSVAEILGFLDENHLPHSELIAAADCPYGEFVGESPSGSESVVCAFWKSATHGIFCDMDLYIYFTFDDARRLLGRTVISFGSNCL